MKRSVRGGHGVIEWLGDADRPWLHFAHATGMCAELYVDLLDPLASDFNIVASDGRGHGQSTLPADPEALTSWRTFHGDLAVLLASYGDTGPWLFAGHSMGASVSLELAAGQPGLASAVVMIEPAFINFERVAAWDAAKADGSYQNPMADQAARRRAVFASRAAAYDNWHGRGVFGGWSDAALTAYVEGGMRDRPDGQVELACTPAWEAATFRSVTSSLEESLRSWAGPLTLLHATVATTVTQADADTIAGLGARVERFDGASHFLPLEEPDAVRAAILERRQA